MLLLGGLLELQITIKRTDQFATRGIPDAYLAVPAGGNDRRTIARLVGSAEDRVVTLFGFNRFDCSNWLACRCVVVVQRPTVFTDRELAIGSEAGEVCAALGLDDEVVVARLRHHF